MAPVSAGAAYSGTATIASMDAGNRLFLPGPHLAVLDRDVRAAQRMTEQVTCTQASP